MATNETMSPSSIGTDLMLLAPSVSGSAQRLRSGLQPGAQVFHAVGDRLEHADHIRDD